MALWQYSFFIIPSGSFRASQKGLLDSEGYFDDAVYWKKYRVTQNYFDDIENILPKTLSWSRDLIIFGNEESNVFKIVIENGCVVSVSFRVDFRNDYGVFLSQVIEFCILNGLIILDERLSVVALNFEIIKRVIEASPQVEKYRRLSKP